MGSQQGQAFEDLRNTISECTRIVRHRWRLALIGLSLVASAAFWGSQYLPRDFSATTLFERRDDVVLQNLIRRNSPYGFDHLKTTMAQDMVGSRALARAAVGLGLLPPDAITSTEALTDDERAALDRVLGRYRLRPDMRLIQSSSSLDTIRLGVTANDSEAARRFAVALRDNYINETRERIREILSSTREFFRSEIQRLETRMAATDEGIVARFEDLPPGVNPTDLAGVALRLEQVRAQFNAAYLHKSELEAQIAAREQFLQSAPEFYVDEPGPQPTTAPATDPATRRVYLVDPALDAAIERIRTELIEARTVRRMTDNHPTVISLTRQLESLDALRETILGLTPPDASAVAPVLAGSAQPVVRQSEAYRHWQTQRARVEMELDALRRQCGEARRAFEEEDARLAQFAALHDALVNGSGDLARLEEQKRTEASELAVWQRHLVDLERVLVAESGERGTQFTLIEEPKGVGRPTRPRVASIFVVCSGLGLAAATLLVALAELFDRSFRSVGQVTRVLGIPVLESVGVIPTPRERRKALVSRLVWAPAVMLLAGALLVSAGIAYASLAMPHLHQRAMERVNHVLGAAGIATAAPLENHWDSM